MVEIKIMLMIYKARVSIGFLSSSRPIYIRTSQVKNIPTKHLELSFPIVATNKTHCEDNVHNPLCVHVVHLITSTISRCMK